MLLKRNVRKQPLGLSVIVSECLPAERLTTELQRRGNSPSLSTAIEETVKALVEFESELDRAKADVTDSKRKAMKDATDWAEGARAAALSRAQEAASQRVAEAKAEAQAESGKIKSKGEEELEMFEGSISRKKSKASGLVRARLLGESS